MKINFETKILGFNRKPLESPELGIEILTMRDVCIAALNGTVEGVKIEPQVKYDQADFAQKIQDHDELDLNLDERKNLKDLIGVYWSPVVVKRAWDILDPPSNEEDKD
jgi:hypothetical protein